MIISALKRSFLFASLIAATVLAVMEIDITPLLLAAAADARSDAYILTTEHILHALSTDGLFIATVNLFKVQ